MDRNYKAELSRQLKGRRETEAYLNEALEDGDPKLFLIALRDVAKAQLGGLGNLAKSSGLNRENLYRMLSKNGNPELTSIKTLLRALGFRLSVNSNKKVE